MDLLTYTAKYEYFKDLVRMHFETGMHELVALAQCLLKAEEDPNVYMEVREHTEKASQELARAEAVTQAELDKMDSECEKMMLMKKNLEDEKKAKSESVKALKSQLCTSVKLREEKMAAIKKIKDYIRQIQQSQAVAEEKVETQRSRRRAALWSMLIPVVGTVIGAGVAFASHIALKDTEEEVAVIEQDINKHRLNMEKYAKEAEKYSKLVEEREARIRDTEKRILEIGEMQCITMALHNQTLQLQEVLRRCTHYLGTLTGKAHVAEITTRYVCDYDNLRRILEDMEQQVLPLLSTNGTEAQRVGLLSSSEITNTIQKLKRLSEPQSIFRKIFCQVKKYLPFGERFSLHYFFFPVFFLFFIRLSFALISFLWFYISYLGFYIICLTAIYILIANISPKSQNQNANRQKKIKQIFCQVKKYLPFGERFSLHYFFFPVFFLFFIRLSFALISFLWFYIICLVTIYILIANVSPKSQNQNANRQKKIKQISQ